MTCFNPRPTSLSGETSSACRSKIRSASFNPRPTSLSGETGLGDVVGPAIVVFQSTPDISVGRNPGPGGGAIGARGFNPRPTSLSGETTQAAEHEGDDDVSIHARHLCRAKPDNSLLPPATGGFNPRPTSLSGETTWRALNGSSCGCFNPRPTSLSGETLRGQTTVGNSVFGAVARSSQRRKIYGVSFCRVH